MKINISILDKNSDPSKLETILLYFYSTISGLQVINLTSSEPPVFDINRSSITTALIDSFNQFISVPEQKEKLISFIEKPQNIILFNKLQQQPDYDISLPLIIDDRFYKKNPYFIQNLNNSHQCELLVSSAFYEKGVDMGLFKTLDDQYRGESSIGVEVKADNRAADTGNLYIEVDEKSNQKNSNFIPSGINKTDNTRWFAFVIDNRTNIIFLDASKVHDLIATQALRYVSENFHNTSHGYLLNINTMRSNKYSINPEVNINQIIDSLKGGNTIHD